MQTDTVTTFFALLALACNAFVLWAIAAWCLRRVRPQWWTTLVELVGPGALVLAAIVAVVATAGSLYLSEVANFPPCRLCWYQRIGMYPLAVILPLAAIRRDAKVWPYAVALVALAFPMSIYHVLLERYPSLETGACEVDNPCSVVWVRHFGTVTIPYMAASAFSAIAVACGVASAWSRKESSHVEP